MEIKLNRIAAFIDSLPEESMLGDVQSTMVSTRVELLGGAIINDRTCSNFYTNCGNCTNYTVDECSGASNAGTCRNGTSMCSGSTNDGICSTVTVPVVVVPIIPPNTGNCLC